MSKIKQLVPEDVNEFDELDVREAEFQEHKETVVHQRGQTVLPEILLGNPVC